MELPPIPARLELWVGPEASVVRTAAGTVDQLESTGFAHRLDDLDRIAALGASAIRLPLLIERLSPRPGAVDFGWADTRLARVQSLGLRPIAGLVHHGSGPPDVDLLDPGFVPRLADFAGRLARRHPWVRDWTPVNEPLTTARFGGLYGFWHPHRRDDAAFVRALLVQVRAIGAAMRAVRAAVPGARLVQTEDIGHVQGTAPLADQVAYENERRWLSLDLLCGRVVPGHPLYAWLVEAADADPGELAALAREPTPPDVIGLNVYATSERFLDHRLERHAPALHGGNGRQAYADTEAVRVAEARFGGFADRLGDAWARFGRPIALTEVHLGGTRDEQMRWLAEAWDAARAARARGVPVLAVTAWSAFGAVDWDSLLTRRRGHYEPGLFDVRGPVPRPTALATLARTLARGETPRHAALASRGWWRRGVRLPGAEPCAQDAPGADAAPLLIVGRGTLGRAFARVCAHRGLAHRLVGHAELDIADAGAVERQLADTGPWAVVNAAGFVRVDAAELDALQWRANAIGPGVLAERCTAHGARLLSFSSDLVFDGMRRVPYVERDTPRPLNAYGRAKHEAERRLAQHADALVVRTAAFFGHWDTANVPAQGLAQLRRGEPWHAIDDQVVSPTFVPDLVDAALDLLIDGERGIWHLANRGALSWYDFACRIAEAAGEPRERVRRTDGRAAGQGAPRPRYSALASERGALLPGLDAAIERFVAAAAR